MNTYTEYDHRCHLIIAVKGGRGLRRHFNPCPLAAVRDRTVNALLDRWLVQYCISNFIINWFLHLK